MRFKYTPQYGDGEIIYTPRVDICFTNPINKTLVLAFGLVDSGADGTLVHQDIGKALGIEIETGSPVSYRGIGGVVKAYKHTVSLRLVGSKIDFEIECAFAPLEGVDVLLGERGFFENYKVTFEKYKNVFSVTEKKT